MRMFTLLLGAIGSISLIVGGIGVMNVMLVSVTERRREIGIRRALGARRRDIRNQFLIESVVLSMIGGLLGIVLGVGAAYVICIFTDWTFLVSALGVGVASAVGIFFGLYPAWQAARLDPIAALRG
jgi:putative ABC transport system permease protein